jgi:hypothetical protein
MGQAGRGVEGFGRDERTYKDTLCFTVRLCDDPSRFGNSDIAFEWLERGCKARCYKLVFLKVDPRFDPIPSDLRFTRLLKRLGL